MAGTIEGFVTPSGLPTVVRVGIGVAVFALASALAAYEQRIGWKRRRP